MSYQEKLREWAKLTGESLPTRPTLPPEQVLKLRCRLKLEEAMEFIGACGFDVAIGLGGRFDLVPNGDAPDLTAMAHELADNLYIDFGTANALGLDMGPVFDEVHAANLRKVGPDGALVLRADGKILKPADWKPANVAAVLAALSAGEVAP